MGYNERRYKHVYSRFYCLLEGKSQYDITIRFCESPIPEIPFEIISTDHLSPTPTTAGNQYVFVHISHAIRYVLARPT